ncbi:MAG TPA: flagellar biosynthetic protein FliO [Candidatus Paceibacterota bacterium]|nr:flagellar biosynthetic protein FliO [Candidatus Paceibacterota bacterium]
MNALPALSRRIPVSPPVCRRNAGFLLQIALIARRCRLKAAFLRHASSCFILLTMFVAFAAPAQTTNANPLSTNTPPAAALATNAVTTESVTAHPLTLNNSLPDVTGSVLNVFGALAIVLAVFLGGVWLFRNWQRLTIHRGRAPKLNVLESKSLGGRHAIYVVGYENERFLISSSPTGINMLTHLQPADETEVSNEPNKPSAPQANFAATLTQMLKGK